MKSFSGTTKCRCCRKDFEWMYIDDGYRKGYEEYITDFATPEVYGSYAPCSRRIVIPHESEFFTTHCPHCQADVAIECSERIMEELYAKSW